MRSNQKGYSIVEVLIAAGIVGIIAVSVMSSFPFMTKMNIRARSGGSCRAYLDAAFGRIEAVGFRGKVEDINANIPTKFNLVTSGASVLGIPGNQLRPQVGLSLVQQNFSDDITQLRTPALLTSSVSVVNALYRSSSSICAGTFSVSGSGLTASPFLPTPPNDLHDPSDPTRNDFTVNLRIQPFDLHQKKIAGCSDVGFDTTSIAIPAPKGVKIGDPSDLTESRLARTESEGDGSILPDVRPIPPVTADDPIARQMHPPPSPLDSYDATSVAENRNNLGFAVSLRVTFKNKDRNDTSGATDKLSTCEETRIIAYPADLQKPATPTVFRDPAHKLRNTPWNMTDFSYLDYWLEFRYQGEAGAVLMCRDFSTSAPGSIGHEADGKIYPLSTEILQPSPRRNRWVPCESVTVCGHKGAPAAAGDVFGTPSNFQIVRKWTNDPSIGTAPGNPALPYGCHVRLEVVAVDPAGNVSDSGWFDELLQDLP